MAALNFPASPSNGDTYDNFVYDATKGAWKLQTIAGNDLTDLNDVTVTSPSDGDILVYNGTSGKWESAVFPPPEVSLGLVIALG